MTTSSKPCEMLGRGDGRPSVELSPDPGIVIPSATEEHSRHDFQGGAKRASSLALDAQQRAGARALVVVGEGGGWCLVRGSLVKVRPSGLVAV